jgi:LysM repeat protein
MHAMSPYFLGMATLSIAASSLQAAPAKTESAKTIQSTKAYQDHIVKRGETLWSIAQQHGTSVGEVMDYNHMPNEAVREGMTLKIPQRQVTDPRKARQHIHIVAEGETFWTVASDYGVSAEGLAKANPNVNPSRVHQDMELIIPAEEPGSEPLTEKAAITSTTADSTTKPTKSAATGNHVVQTGETFYSIGKKYGVSITALMTSNPSVKPERLSKGMQLVIPGKAPVTSSPTKTVAKTGTNASKPGKLHTVVPRETVSGIARKYGVSEEALLRQNQLERNAQIKAGDVLTIPAATSSAPRLANTAPAPAPASTQAPAGNSPEAAPTQQPASRAYVVSAGETAGTIAEAFDITKQQLFEFNHLPANAKLNAGDQIQVPLNAANMARR